VDLGTLLKKGLTEGCDGIDINVVVFRTVIFFVLCALTVSGSLLVMPEMLGILLPYQYPRELLFTVSAAVGLVSSGSAFIMYGVYRALDEVEIDCN
jgi:hypothetical protein